MVAPNADPRLESPNAELSDIFAPLPTICLVLLESSSAITYPCGNLFGSTPLDMLPFTPIIVAPVKSLFFKTIPDTSQSVKFS